MASIEVADIFRDQGPAFRAFRDFRASRAGHLSLAELKVMVGLTLSAKGELLFIAEAGAEASIKFTLKRR